MRTGRIAVPTMLIIAAVMLAGPVHAAGDAEAGEKLAFTCLGCHGIEGYRNAYPSYRVPKLRGQRAEYIVNALTAYRDGTRPHATMRAHGGSLSDQDIEDLAAYFQGDEPAEDTVTADDIAGLDAAQTCLQCHGVGGDVVVPKPPVLSGQYQDYLVHALNQYRDGDRTGNVMTAFAAMLSDDDIERLAEFYSARDGLTTPDKKD